VYGLGERDKIVWLKEARKKKRYKRITDSLEGADVISPIVVKPLHMEKNRAALLCIISL
jgi:hypothetical protein